MNWHVGPRQMHASMFLAPLQLRRAAPKELAGDSEQPHGLADSRGHEAS